MRVKLFMKDWIELKSFLMTLKKVKRRMKEIRRR
jgi:hypothetical protein